MMPLVVKHLLQPVVDTTFSLLFYCFILKFKLPSNLILIECGSGSCCLSSPSSANNKNVIIVIMAFKINR